MLSNYPQLNKATLWDLLDGAEATGSGSSSSSSSSSSPCNDEIGSLAYECIDAVDSRIAGYTAAEAAAALPLFSTIDHANATYVRNTDSWLNDIVDQITCFPVYTSDRPAYPQRRGGALISPRHLAMAWHSRVPNGTVMRFVDVDNNVVEREVTATQRVYWPPPDETTGSDIAIALFDSDVPSSISFTKVMPSDWDSYLPSFSNICTVPAVSTHQNKHATVRDAHGVLTHTISFNKPIDSQRVLFYEVVEYGDSGSPAFFIINDELVLLTTWFSGGGGGGPFYTHFISEINTVMTSLGGGYQLTTVDLSSFTSY